MDKMTSVKRKVWMSEIAGLDTESLSRVTTGCVRPADRETLDLGCEYSEYSISTHAIHLLGRQGLIKRVGISSGTRIDYRLSFSRPWIRKVTVTREYQTEENVLEAILGDPRAKATKWIAVWKGYDSWADVLIIHRIPGKFKDAEDWVNAMLAKEAEELVSQQSV